MAEDLGIYLHIPFCKHECPYCDFTKVALSRVEKDFRRDFVDLLIAELDLRLAGNAAAGDSVIETVYFGGGTPSLLRPSELERMLSAIEKRFPRFRPSEVTLEVNPENVLRERPAQWRSLGINRVSMGVQSFQSSELALLERLHGPETILRAFDHLLGAELNRISLDLMFALPGQSLTFWEQNLSTALALPINHLSLYGLTFEEGTPFHRRFGEAISEARDDEAQRIMFLRADELASAAGFEHYEISNFAKPECRAVHNQRYWHQRPVLAVGPGASGTMNGIGYRNHGGLDDWRRKIVAGVAPSEESAPIASELMMMERLFTLLRLREGVDAVGEPELYGACKRWADKNRELDYCFVLSDSRFRLTVEGWLLHDGLVQAMVGSLNATEIR